MLKIGFLRIAQKRSVTFQFCLACR